MEVSKKSKRSKRNLIILIVTLSIGSLTYRILTGMNFHHTSLLFIGIPALLSLMIIKYTDKPKTLYGVVFRTVTLFLLISGILLGEGLICILMAAPIFYGVAGIIALIYDYGNRHNDKKLRSVLLIPILVLMVQPQELFRNSPEYVVSNSKTFAEPIDLTRLNENPDFMADIPFGLSIGFPKPVANTGTGLQVGDTRSITFESSTKGQAELLFQIVNSEEDKVVFRQIQDETHIGTWLTWSDVTVEVNQSPAGEYVLTWTTTFTCDLGPSWYFGLMQQAAISASNEYLMNAFFSDAT